MATFTVEQPTIAGQTNQSFDIKLPEEGQVFRGVGGGVYKRQGGKILQLGGDQQSEKLFTGRYGADALGSLERINLADVATAIQKGIGGLAQRDTRQFGVAEQNADATFFAPSAFTKTQGGTVAVDPVVRAKEVQSEIAQGVTGAALPEGSMPTPQAPSTGPSDSLKALSIGLAQGKTPEQLQAEIQGLTVDEGAFTGNVTEGVDLGTGSFDFANIQPTSIQDIMSQQLSIQQQIAKEKAKQNQLDIAGLQGSTQIGSQTIAQPLIGAQRQALEQQIAFQQLPISANIQALTDQLGISQQALTNAISLAELSKPNTQVLTETNAKGEIVATVLDKETGDIIKQSVIGQTEPTKRSTAVVEAGGYVQLIDTQTGQVIKTLGVKDVGGGGLTIPEGTTLTPEEQKQTLRKIILEQKDATAREGAFGALASFKNAKDLIDSIDSGASTGILSGVIRGGINPFGITLVPGTSQLGISGSENIEFDSASTAFVANFIKALSGVQVTDKEREFLMETLPSKYADEKTNKLRLRTLTDTLKNKYELQLGINFNDFPDEIPDISGSNELENLFNSSIK